MSRDLESLIDSFTHLEKKIDDNMAVRQEILNKLNQLVTDVSILKKDFYGNGVEGVHRKVHRHEGYFLKLKGGSILITSSAALVGSAVAVVKLWKW